MWKDDHSLWLYETGLKYPSLLSFSSLASSFIRKAQKEIAPEIKAYLYKQAEAAIEKGLDRFNNSTIRETTPHLFRLYFFQSILAEDLEVNLKTRLDYYRQAYGLKPEQEAVSDGRRGC